MSTNFENKHIETVSSDSESEESGYYPFSNVCMQPTHICHMCERSCGFNQSKLVYFGRLEALVLCSDQKCKDKAKQDIISYVNKSKIIPMFSFFKHKKDIKFYRSSQKNIVDGYLYVDNDRYFKGGLKWKDNEQMFGICVGYDTYHRYVSLENIFHHNKDFYHNMMKCNNILDDDLIQIKMTDLSKEIQNTLLTIYNQSLTKKSSEYRW